MDAERLEEVVRQPRRARMVRWFDPAVLARSAVQVALANVFGRHSDTRLIEALASQPQGVFDYSHETGDFWLDYVADIGDGWNSTYAVAHALAQPELVVQGAEGPVRTHAGRVLMFGGDQIYPYPSRDAYEHHTEKPYGAAFHRRESRPDLYALPGNHDWYDSLVAFSRTFCRPERGFAGCATRQTRSYFALKLPANWWLLGIDLQLGADLDEPQVRYFQDVARQMDVEARIVLCLPEPQWIYEEAYPKERSYEAVTLRYFEEKILARPVSMFLTGDLHHYRRHENAGGVQKVVSGGGGAFLHATHVPAKKRLAKGFVERAAYPDRKTSQRLAWRNLGFPVLNPRFMILPGLLYALSAWFASASLDAQDLGSMGQALHACVVAAIRDPIDGLWVLALASAFVFFTDTHARWYRIAGGLAHAAAHLGGAFLIGWGALQLTTGPLGLGFGTVPQLLVSGAVTFAGGALLGSFVMGLYLLVSLRVFGRHADQAFSALHVEDFKQWLRLRIDASGHLTLYAIGIDRVARRWREGGTHARRPEDVSLYGPADAAATPPRLVDTVVVTGRR